MKRLRVDQYNSRVQNAIAAALEKPIKTVQAFPAPVEQAKGKIRQNSSVLNKTEQAFYDYLKSCRALFPEIHAQAITLKLANGVRYTPDFIVRGIGDMWAYEVKGFMRDDAAVKLKVAASLYPWIRFNLVWKVKGGGWHVQEVLA